LKTKKRWTLQSGAAMPRTMTGVPEFETSPKKRFLKGQTEIIRQPMEGEVRLEGEGKDGGESIFSKTFGIKRTLSPSAKKNTNVRSGSDGGGT